MTLELNEDLLYLEWSCSIVAFQYSNSFTLERVIWLIFHSTTSFPQTQSKKPIATGSLFSWQLFWWPPILFQSVQIFTSMTHPATSAFDAFYDKVWIFQVSLPHYVLKKMIHAIVFSKPWYSKMVLSIGLGFRTSLTPCGSIWDLR